MARFPDRFINQVAEATDIVEVVGQFIALKKRGKEFLGICPFHQDHRPSLNVSPSKQIFKCFACGAGGGVFQFLQQHLKLSFPEAVRELANRAGISVPADEAPGRPDSSPSGESLLKMTTFAARFFRDQLNSPAGSDALEYARARKLTDESIARFGLGFAPDSWDALRSAAVGAGFTDRQLAAAGLVAEREDGSSYDRFRNRLMFPIVDAAGRVVAFGGRAMDEADRAKYLNSPETALFDKSANLYALNWSRRGIVDSGQAVVVEGYLDALMCIQQGVVNVVATLGTALTERHVRVLARVAREVVLVFDSDVAGQAATERAVELFLMQRLNVRIGTVPGRGGQDGAIKDPCDYVLAEGADRFRELLAEAPDALTYAWSRRRADYQRATTLAEKRSVIDDFLALIISSGAHGAIDPVRKGLLAGQVAELVGVSQTEITEQMRRLARRVRRGSAAARTQGQGPTEADGRIDRAESWLLGVLLNAPELFGSVAEKVAPEMFADPAMRAVAEQVWTLARAERLDVASLLAAGQSEQWGRIVTDLQATGEKRGNYERILADAADAMCRRQERETLQDLKSKGDAHIDEVMRRIHRQARSADPRRRPKLP